MNNPPWQSPFSYPAPSAELVGRHPLAGHWAFWLVISTFTTNQVLAAAVLIGKTPATGVYSPV